MWARQGSVVTPARTPASEAAAEQLRASLRLGIKGAWSQEAVRRGVASAKVTQIPACIVSCQLLPLPVDTT
jgi:hypothetical protein